MAFSFFTKGKKQKDGVNWVENEKMSLRICGKKNTIFFLSPGIHLILRFLGVGNDEVESRVNCKIENEME